MGWAQITWLVNPPGLKQINQMQEYQDAGIEINPRTKKITDTHGDSMQTPASAHRLPAR
jgi:hypothetical protein